MTPRVQASIRAADLARVVGGSHAAHESLQQASLDLLRLCRIPALPIYTGPRVRPRPGGGWDLRRNTEQRGLFDVLACFPPAGLLVLLDFKTGNARLSKEQRELAARFRRAGAVVAAIRVITDVQRLIAQYAPTQRQGGPACEF